MRRAARRRLLRRVLAALAGLLLLAGGLVAWVGTVSFRTAAGPADTAVVLSAAIYGARPSPVFEERIKHAIDLYRERRVRRILFTGGVGERDVRAEAAVARAYALARGVPPEAILCEAGSRTTFENLLAARTLLGAEGGRQRLLLVSDPLHMARALAMARELGLDAAPAPTPTTRFRSTRSRLRFLLRESYYLAGYLAQRPFVRPPARWPAEGDPPPCE
ncbi:MAG TPA: YdcF family protein [Thermoanaerobaculia bacterium]|nr:YdcF family protein [Thermoanaerobaculia bacterium]